MDIIEEKEKMIKDLDDYISDYCEGMTDKEAVIRTLNILHSGEFIRCYFEDSSLPSEEKDNIVTEVYLYYREALDNLKED